MSGAAVTLPARLRIKRLRNLLPPGDARCAGISPGALFTAWSFRRLLCRPGTRTPSSHTGDSSHYPAAGVRMPRLQRLLLPRIQEGIVVGGRKRRGCSPHGHPRRRRNRAGPASAGFGATRRPPSGSTPSPAQENASARGRRAPRAARSMSLKVWTHSTTTVRSGPLNPSTCRGCGGVSGWPGAGLPGVR